MSGKTLSDEDLHKGELKGLRLPAGSKPFYIHPHPLMCPASPGDTVICIHTHITASHIYGLAGHTAFGKHSMES